MHAGSRVWGGVVRRDHQTHGACSGCSLVPSRACHTPITEQEHVRPSDYVRVAAYEMAKRIGMNETSNQPASYCSLHVARGPWLQRIPGLDKATRPENIIASISHKCPPLSNLYLSTNEEDLKIFDPLRDVYNLTIMWCVVSRWFICIGTV